MKSDTLGEWLERLEVENFESASPATVADKVKTTGLDAASEKLPLPVFSYVSLAPEPVKRDFTKEPAPMVPEFDSKLKMIPLHTLKGLLEAFDFVYRYHHQSDVFLYDLLDDDMTEKAFKDKKRFVKQAVVTPLAESRAGWEVTLCFYEVFMTADGVKTWQHKASHIVLPNESRWLVRRGIAKACERLHSFVRLAEIRRLSKAQTSAQGKSGTATA